MIHGIRNSFLYSSSRIINHSMCTNGEQCSCGTGFWVKNSKNEICLITNKHVLKHSEDSNKFCNFFDVHIWEASNGNTEEKPGGFSIYRFFSFTPDVPNNPLDDIVCIRWPFKAYSLSPSKSTSLKIDYFFPYSILASQNDFDNNLAVCDMLAFTIRNDRLQYYVQELLQAIRGLTIWKNNLEIALLTKLLAWEDHLEVQFLPFKKVSLLVLE